MAHLKLKQIDRALEWHLRRLVTAAGYWPDMQQLVAAGATPEQLEQQKAAIRAGGRELIEVFGVAPWADRGTMKGNNLVVSRLTTGTGSYARADVQETVAINPLDLSQGYRVMQVPESPQNVRYEVRYVADDTIMDREITELILTAFGGRRYLHGLNDDLSTTAEGFWVVPSGDSVDMSEDDFTERLWRLVVQDVVLVPAVEVDRVAAATDLALTLEARESAVTVAIQPES